MTLSPRGQVGLEAKILSLSSSVLVLKDLSSASVLALNFSFGPCEMFVMLVLVAIIFLSSQWLVNCVTYLLIMSMVVNLLLSFCSVVLGAKTERIPYGIGNATVLRE